MTTETMKVAIIGKMVIFVAIPRPIIEHAKIGVVIPGFIISLHKK
jgi:hypothetical protein